MFCFQCEQTAKGEGCTKIGVCGKQPDTAVLQDLLIYTVKGLSQVAVEAGRAGVSDAEVNHYTCEAIFSTLTNVDFDPDRFVALIKQGVELRDRLKSETASAGSLDGPAAFSPAGDRAGMVTQGEAVGVMADESLNADIRSLRELLIYGVKGLAAYADHARILGQEDRSGVCLYPRGHGGHPE
jgi:hydroxylamine reductase